MAVPSLNAMTPQQKVFAEEYLIDLNSTQAAIRAGYPPGKAASYATTIMRHPPVRDHIARLMAARSKRVGLNADRVLQRLGAMVMGDPRAIFNADGGLKRPDEMDAEDAVMLAGVKTRRTVAMQPDGSMAPEEITEIKVIDAVAVIALAMKHLGMMNDKLDINVTHSLAERLGAAQARISKARGGVTLDAEFIDEGVAALKQLEKDSAMLQDTIESEEPAFMDEPPLGLEGLW